MPNENTKRIAKNTLMLYFRMLLIMGVSLYTVRVVLKTLGVVDYGIYNVVGGIVTMFTFLSGTMATASQRFFAFELGRNDLEQLKKTFSLTVTIYAGISVVILLLAETVGLWFLNTYLNIPPSRMEAANWVYQFAIFSFLITIMTVPYNAAIIAHENMKVFAYVSIVEALLKLIIVYLLVLFSYDKLKLYAILLLLTTCINTFIYRTICRNKYEECHFSFFWDKGLYKILLSYSGWNLFGSTAAIMNNHGINILLNIFFGPTINAARAIAYQVSSAVSHFISNFTLAVKPQITKTYAAGQKDEMIKLVFQSSKFSYFLMFILSLPILIETKYLLSIWLKNTPDYAIIFTRLTVIAALIESLSYSLMAAAQATGEVKYYQSIVGGFMLLNLPVTYLFLKFGSSPEIAMIIAVINTVVCLFLRLYMLRRMINFSVKNYMKNVLVKILTTTILSYIIPIYLLLCFAESLFRFIVISFSGILLGGMFILIFGITKTEKDFVLNIVLRNRLIKSIIFWSK